MKTTTIPMPLRQLRSKMALKDLSLQEVSDAAGVSYTAASAILSGRLINTGALAKLRTAIKSAPMPEQLQPA